MNWLVMSKPAWILSLSKIGAIVLAVEVVSRLIPATASAAVCPVSCCCFASSVMVTAPPLIALLVVEPASPDAFIATGGVAEKPL
ncbi:hypothetical protein R69658_08208 [Paraburkholderia aspalathi]|uniref:Secreted protein n=1 Tax=Paraburkholderia aspalathi TaxID=1324617 RepID=A0ABM8T9G8_9BURK|nr:hypothetical protein R69658_08208 [Paraburkholderia aspalathi]